MQGKHQRETTQGLLPPAQIADILPALLGRHDAEENPLAEGVETIHQLQLRIAAQRDQLVHGLQVRRDGVEARQEGGQPRVAQVAESGLGRVAGGEGGVEVGGAGGEVEGPSSIFADRA